MAGARQGIGAATLRPRSLCGVLGVRGEAFGLYYPTADRPLGKRDARGGRQVLDEDLPQDSRVEAAEPETLAEDLADGLRADVPRGREIYMNTGKPTEALTVSISMGRPRHAADRTDESGDFRE